MEVLPDFRNGIYNVPHTILNILGLKSNKVLEPIKDLKKDKIFFILVDAFGYNLFEKYIKDSCNYDYFKLTSLFPSTTSAVLTTLYTGLSPKEHGILEWYMYYEEFGEIIKTLPFSRKEGKENDELIKLGFSPSNLFNLPTIFEKLKKEDIDSKFFVRKDYASSSYTLHMGKGAKIVPYTSLENAFQLLKKSNAALNFLYLDYLDIAQHHYGPYSKETKDLLLKIWKNIVDLKNHTKERIIVTADHGQIEVSENFIIDVPKNLVGGSPRDVFLYSDYLPSLDYMDALNKEDILKLLGPGKERPKLKERVPNYILLPRDSYTIWFEDIALKGLHGGLSTEEMFVPFILV